MSERSQAIEDRAAELFGQGLYCSEAILRAYDECLGLRLSQDALRLATGFGAGLGGAKCCCGSITGGVLVVGALHGRTQTTQSEEQAFALSSQLHERFVKQFRFSCCRALTRPVEWGTPEHHQYCDRFVRGAVRILEGLLAEERSPAALPEETEQLA